MGKAATTKGVTDRVATIRAAMGKAVMGRAGMDKEVTDKVDTLKAAMVDRAAMADKEVMVGKGATVVRVAMGREAILRADSKAGATSPHKTNGVDNKITMPGVLLAMADGAEEQITDGE